MDIIRLKLHEILLGCQVYSSSENLVVIPKIIIISNSLFCTSFNNVRVA